MGQELKGDATLDVLAFFARERRRIGLVAGFRDDPTITTDWVNYVEGHPSQMGGETAKNEEGGPNGQ
ncbi:MAG: hypothetical protein EKK29_05960 [Hyphomicrobiales bacterium]|nr:MAG: hypothetical protein EKK29_05960 [Hyphomicrobiales bacterium]